MVTHDQEKAQRVTRAITVVDGELVDSGQLSVVRE
jgi:predicted ABC-type transport system involved in lysophospholipase L1 biosynthesis ATPase subunit